MPIDNVVNPNSLGLIIQSARAGKVSPYNIRLAVITEKLLEIIVQSDSVTASQLEALDKVASLLLMKSEFVANGGRFIEKTKPSIFETGEFEGRLEGNFNALCQLKELIKRNFELDTGSFPRPSPEVVCSEEISVPTNKRLVAIIARLAKKREVDQTPIIVRRKTIDLRAAMGEIMDRLKKGIQLLFSLLLTKNSTRFDVITNLLAILELAKRKKVLLYQEEPFGPIYIDKA